MADQQYPPPTQQPQTFLVPPKPTGQENAPAPTYQPNQPYQQPQQQGSTSAPIDTNKVYPTPEIRPAEVPLPQYYPQAGQPYQQQQGYPQAGQQPAPGQQPVPGQQTYPLPVQPAQPGAQNQPYPQGGPTPPSQQVGQTSSYPTIPPQPYQQPQQQPQQQQWQQGQTQLPASSGFGVTLFLSIVAILFCGGLLAVPALVFAFPMNTAYKQRNVPLYYRYRRNSRIWLIVAVCVGIVVNIIYVTMLMNGVDLLALQ